jgi:hypothetical protein
LLDGNARDLEMHFPGFDSGKGVRPSRANLAPHPLLRLLWLGLGSGDGFRGVERLSLQYVIPVLAGPSWERRDKSSQALNHATSKAPDSLKEAEPALMPGLVGIQCQGNGLCGSLEYRQNCVWH